MRNLAVFIGWIDLLPFVGGLLASHDLSWSTTEWVTSAGKGFARPRVVEMQRISPI